MVKTCNICNHTGELTWRDGKYYCAMCGSEVAATEPQPQYSAPAQSVVTNAVCPICKNAQNNTFDGTRYRCALCSTYFERRQQVQERSYQPGSTYGHSQRYHELKKQKSKYCTLGILFIMLFWPVSIYFFYKYYQTSQELKALNEY